MKNENFHEQYHPHELAHAERMNAALEALRRGAAPETFSADPAFQTLVRLHVQTSDVEAQEEFMDDVEELLLARFAPSSGRPSGDNASARVRVSFWRAWTMPIVSFALVAAVVVGVSKDIIPFDTSFFRGLFPDSAPNRTNVTNTTTNVVALTNNANNPLNNNNAAVAPGEDDEEEPAPLPSVTAVSGITLAGVEQEISDVESAKKEVEQTMNDMEAFAKEWEELEATNDVNSIVNDFESLNL